MSALLRAEVRKIVATPVNWWLLVGTVGIGVVGTLAPLIAAEGSTGLLSDRKLQEAMHGAAAGASLVLVAGIIGMAGEWRFGQGTQTFLTTPRRWKVVAAKCLAYLGLGAVYGVAAGVGSVATAWSWYRANDVSLPFGRSAVWLTLLGCWCVAVIFGALGVGVGAIARNQTAAVVAALAWQVLIEPALFAASPDVFKWLPGMASFAVRRQPTEGLLTVGPATIVLLTVLGVVLLIGLRTVDRDDVTA